MRVSDERFKITCAAFPGATSQQIYEHLLFNGLNLSEGQIKKAIGHDFCIFRNNPDRKQKQKLYDLCVTLLYKGQSLFVTPWILVEGNWQTYGFPKPHRVTQINSCKESWPPPNVKKTA